MIRRRSGGGAYESGGGAAVSEENTMLNTIQNILNFSIGMILGVIGSAMWQYDKFLYFSVFCVQIIIVYILINYTSTSLNKDLTENQK